MLVSLITNQLISSFGNASHDPMGIIHWVPTSSVDNSNGFFC